MNKILIYLFISIHLSIIYLDPDGRITSREEKGSSTFVKDDPRPTCMP